MLIKSYIMAPLNLINVYVFKTGIMCENLSVKNVQGCLMLRSFCITSELIIMIIALITCDWWKKKS